MLSTYLLNHVSYIAKFIVVLFMLSTAAFNFALCRLTITQLGLSIIVVTITRSRLATLLLGRDLFSSE
jgi:hypothetical protein